MSKSQIHLGASLYVPATQQPAQLAAIGNGQKFPNLRSVIYCTEDAIREDEVNQALNNLTKTLPELSRNHGPMRFIRVRNPHILGQCMTMPFITKIDGFVLPKITADNLNHYLVNFSDGDHFSLMPTLETAEVADSNEMTKLRRMLQHDSRAARRILCLRIGGNDLLNCLRVRRDPRRTIYATAVGALISRLAFEFVSHGFGLTGPVCEVWGDNTEILREEVELDMLHGLFGKTAIHPSQIDIIQDCYAVDAAELDEAHRIVRNDASAVFRAEHITRMEEPATHRRWAEDIIDRAQVYTVNGQLSPARLAAVV